MITLLLSSGTHQRDENVDLSFQGITFLTFQAVLEVVIICFAGFITAKLGLLNPQNQKVISQLNVDLFTPCLVFTKLASSLSLKKMVEVIVIPIFFCILTGISYGSSLIMNRLLDLNEPEGNFVSAMAVFSNSNSLPVSLTLSLAYTLPDLLWEDIEDDNSDMVASRGILYLLIFQQLGQIVRWSWGYNTLLRKRSPEELNNYPVKQLSTEEEARRLIRDDTEEGLSLQPTPESTPLHPPPLQPSPSKTQDGSGVESTVVDSSDEDPGTDRPYSERPLYERVWYSITKNSVVKGVLEFMNPPLYAMLVSVIVASVPTLRDAIFNQQDSFVHNTLTNSITQLGSVSIPLILIVLGSNLYPSKDVPPPSKHYQRIVFASVLSRMILPSLIMLPLISLCVKFINASILDDPIFLIVSFLLTISPPAIQLSQITQLNNIYQKEMTGVLFWGYVMLTLPTTIIIVVTSLEVLKWAK